ncbi:hypothetical protein [Streptacidiphilus melanogenes]|uniref:hypothetical protein n=1 Tax=Streptacidiphilus melanogenes TaxID=411235 RepID=UPI00069389A4|nr:hypothetical protein [Streptacidiphilus melanogenes]
MRVWSVHFVIDTTHAERLRRRWDDLNIPVPLKVVDCPDRRVARAAGEYVLRACGGRDDTMVDVLLPRRTYAPPFGRLLHDRTADKIAGVVSRIPHAAATIIPFDVRSRIRRRFPQMPEERLARGYERLVARMSAANPGQTRHQEVDDQW